MVKKFWQYDAVLRCAGWLLSAYLGLALRSTRWTIVGSAFLAPFEQGGPVVVAFWHESLPLMPAVWRRVIRKNPGREVAVLISRNRDGNFIAGIMARFGIGAVRGSTARPGRAEKGGAAAGVGLLAALGRGAAVVMTPDGPRGPHRVAAGGVARLAALSGAKVLPMGACSTPRLRLPSWDRMGIPVPFSRGTIVCLAPIEVSREGETASLPLIEAALTEAARQAEQSCGL